MVMDYDVIVAAMHALAKEGWTRQEVVRADGYPVYVMTDPKHEDASSNLPSLLVAAGIHGEEPAAVIGLKQWLTGYAARWVGKIRIRAFPCLNPWGYERGIRFGAHGNDLNREFDAPVHATVRAFNDWLGTQRFDLFMDLHEDCDFETMYLYEVRDRSERRTETLGKRILRRAARTVALSHGDKVGDFFTEHGIVQGELDRAGAREFTERPIAIHVFTKYTSHVVTVETPGLLDLELRARLHVDALEEACEYLVSIAANQL